ncbi:uncharacterized protein Dwil_GK28240 [Drosophila willistoni]|uniref:C-type lectin domain-containing protein n=1 Tax=Drosophila willistoni TaxID=7260 RepID=A0A0Q9WY25_DROWI|nr:uncharacterized protein Dwil_GK28240 [Drosophila willistoni]
MCRDLNAVLFAFDSLRDQNLLTGNLQVLGIPFNQGYLDSIWTAITSLGTANQTTFVLHHNGQALDYANWCPDEPKDVKGLDCVGYAKIDDIFGYHNIECDLYSSAFVCETRPVTTEDYLCLKKEIFVETQLTVQN